MGFEVINTGKGLYVPIPPDGELLVGQRVRQEPQPRLWGYALQVSNELAEHPYTMLQYSPTSLVESMISSHSVLCLERASKRLLAFGQIWHYGRNVSGQEAYEFGSWLSFERGFGQTIVPAARNLAYELYPNGQLIAIVEHENRRASKTLEMLGARELGFKNSEYLTSQAGLPAVVRVYDITKGV